MESSVGGNSVPMIYDVKETLLRTRQLILFGLAIMAFTGYKHFSYGNYLSSLLIAAFFIFFCILLVQNLCGKVQATKMGIITGTCVLLILISFAEGLKTAAYLYFLPLVFAIPIIVENNKIYSRETMFYFLLTIVSCSICLLFAPEKSSWQKISEEAYKEMNYINTFSVLFLSAAFAYLHIFFERKYIKALIKEKKHAEEAGQAKARFLSNMGHELRTPLNGIVGTANILKKELALPEQKEYLDILKYCSDYMLELVNDILDFNKIEAGKMELNLGEFNLKKLLQRSIIPFNHRNEEKKLHFLVELDEELDCTVSADETRLIQVLNNLLSNAWKFTDQGHVKLKAELVGQNSNSITVRIAVEDTGIGIEEAHLQKIFDSFWQVNNQSTRKYRGSGLGLTISQKILHLMGSNLTVSSQLGKGTVMSFVLPLQRGSIPKNAVSPGSIEKDLSGVRILMAEDNPINMKIAKKLLLDWNTSLTTCENGLEVIHALRRGLKYDLILLDLEMPVMDGYTAMKEIVKIHPGVPVIAFTAALVDSTMCQALKAQGFSDCLLKPFHPGQLFEKIQKYVKTNIGETGVYPRN